MKRTNFHALSDLPGRDFFLPNCQCDYCDFLDDVPMTSLKDDAILSISPFAPSWEIPETSLMQILDLFEFDKPLDG